MFDSYRRYSPDSSGLSVALSEATRQGTSDVKQATPFTGVAQRQRDGLITRRSHDRNVSPVLFHFAPLKKRVVIARAT
jgi:hypothetical protein